MLSITVFVLAALRADKLMLSEKTRKKVPGQKVVYNLMASVGIVGMTETGGDEVIRCSIDSSHSL
jgi:hypothetical protein